MDSDYDSLTKIHKALVQDAAIDDSDFNQLMPSINSEHSVINK